MIKYNDVQSENKKEVNLWEYWMVVMRRKWTIFTFVLVLFATVTIRSYTIKPTYTAQGTLLIEKEPNILTFEELFQIESYSADYYQTQYRLLQSRALVDNTLERLKLYGNDRSSGKPEKENDANKDFSPASKGALINSFLGRLGVSPIRETRLVEISFKDQNPEFAASAVNALFDSFIDMNIEAKFEATEEATEFLTGQIASLRTQITEKENELQKYGAERNIIALSDTETTIVDKLGELSRALTGAQIDRVIKESYYNEIRIASPDYIPEALTNTLIQRLREDYVRLKREFIKKEETFRPEYPEMQRLKAELDSAKTSLESETQNLIKGAYSDFQAALKKESSLEDVFNVQKQEAINLNSNAILYNSLKIEIENKNNLLGSLLRRESETGVSARLRGLRKANVRIVDRAEVPFAPSSPNKKLNMIMALIAGLAGGFGLAFFFDYLDNSIKTPEEVEQYTNLPTYGIIPTFSSDELGRRYGQKRKKTKDKGKEASEKKKEIKTIELIPQFSPHSTYSESYRSIRTALLLSTVDSNLKAIGVTSPLPKEGKSVTVANLGVVLAQAGKNVLIVDSDLRKPRQHKIFQVKNINGITNYMINGFEIKELIKQTLIPGLFLINSGPIPPNPAELLGSEKMEKFIENLKESFDHVLFDMPPMLNIADALVMGTQIDGILLVIEGGKTSREAVIHAKERLDLMKIKTIGAILNNVDIKKQGGYYYKHYYSYYYGKDDRPEDSLQI